MKYLKKHKPENQATIRGVIVNPLQRDDFDNTANESRPPGEWSDWCGLRYVVGKEDWWEVRCLDGGAWDRATVRTFCKSMDEAIGAVLDHRAESSK